jgi:uncharacterized protein YjiS (DUF1127 family)
MAGLVSLTIHDIAALQHEYCAAASTKGDGTMAMTKARFQPTLGIALEDARGIAQRVRFAIAQATERRKRYQRTLGELRALSDRELADIGIARVNINQIARDHALAG